MFTTIKKILFHPLKIMLYNIEIALFGAWKFFQKQQKQQEKVLVRNYYVSTYTPNKNVKGVIFMCNGFIWHGGLADRLKGMVSVYEWCKQKNIPYYINFSHPFELSDYLEPNTYNWTISSSYISYNRNIAKPKICLMEPRTCNKKEVIKNNDFLLRNWMNENLVIPDMQIHIYTNMNCGNKHFSLLFNELFKPSKELHAKLQQCALEINGKYISISFRFAKILGDFKDCTGEEYTEEKKKKIIEDCIKAIKYIRKSAPIHDKILITADSQRFLKNVKKQIPNSYVAEGPIGHIDYISNHDINMKTFIDFLLISKAEKVYLVKNEDMYRSAFAEQAAMINNLDFCVYEF